MSGVASLSTIARPQASPVRGERPGRVETSVATPFDALLDATRQNVRARTLSEVRESPEQMFEAKNVDARQQRKEMLQDADSPIEQPPLTKDAMAPAVSRHAPTGGDTRREPVSTGREPSSRGPATEGASAPSGHARIMTPSPTYRPTVPPPAVEATAQRNSPEHGSGRGGLTTLNALPVSSNQGATGATQAVASTTTSAIGGEQPIARAFGEALGAKAIHDVAGSQGTMTAARPADGKSAAPQTTQAKPSAETAPSPQPTTETDTSLSPFERLVRSIRLNIGERVSTARMELDPPELGRMHVEVHMRGDAVELEVRTSNEAARELVAGRADELKLALEQHGVQVQRFDVVVEGPTVGPRRRGDDGEKSTRRRDGGSTGERAETRGVLSRVGRLDVRV